MAGGAMVASYKLRPHSQQAQTQRCISTNLIVVHQDGGKPPIVKKQSSFNVTNDGRVTESPNEDDIIFGNLMYYCIGHIAN